MASEKKKGILAEFGEFISKGNVLDLAVGVIIGGAFTTVVNSLVENIVQPIISFVTGGNETIPGLAINLNGQVIDFSAFLSSIINFLLTAAAVFAIIKSLNKLRELKDKAEKKAGLEHEEEAAPAPRTCPYCKTEIADDATRCPHCTSKLEGYVNAVE